MPVRFKAPARPARPAGPQFGPAAAAAPAGAVHAMSAIGMGGAGGVLTMARKQLREDLTIAHQLIAHYGWDDLVWNHISGRLPNTPADQAVVTPGNLMFDEITPSSLVTGSVNNTATVIHRAIYEGRPDINCIVHSHAPSIMAVSVLTEGFQYLTQDAAQFYGGLSYHNWEGMSETDDEKPRLIKSLGSGHTLIMRNHGACCTGSTVAEAWVRMYYLIRCCQVQVDAARFAGASAGATGHLIVPSDAIMSHAAGQITEFSPPGMFEWEPLRRKMMKKHPEVFGLLAKTSSSSKL